MFKKLLISFLIIYPLSFIYALNYEYLIDYNNKNFIIKVKNFEINNYYLCNFDDFSCDKVNDLLNIAPYNFRISFPSNNFKFYIGQIKINNNYLTILYNDSNKSFTIFKFNKKIDKAFFSNDNSKILIISKNNGYLFNLQNKDLIKTFNTYFNLSYLTLSPNLKFLAYYKNRTFYIYDIFNNKNYKILNKENTYWDLLTENNKVFDFLDDSRLFFLSDHENYQTLYLFDLNSNRITKLLKENFVIKDFLVLGNKIYFVGNKEKSLRWDLYEYDINNNEINKILENVVYDFSITKLNNFLVTKITGEVSPSIVFYDLDKKTIIKPKLNLTKEKIRQGEINNIENIWYATIEPDNFDKTKEYNLIVWLHGGPYRQTSAGYHPYSSYGFYDLLLEKLRSSGYLITKVDYIGSMGYGRKFAEELKNNIGKKDVESVIKVINHLKNNYKIRDVYLMGNSYGGYLSLKIIYEYPSKINGAISINGVTDWWTLINNNKYSIFKIHFNGYPTKNNLELYNQASIFLKKENLKNKKVLLIYGKKDRTVPISQNSLFTNAYNKIAKIENLELDEAHVLIKRETLDKIYKKIIDFLTLE